MEQLLKTVQEQAEEGEFDELDEVLGELGGRPEELFWKEASDGTLLVGDSRRTPETLARVALSGGELTAEEVTDDSVNWGRPFLSSPEQGISDRQFD